MLEAVLILAATSGVVLPTQLPKTKPRKTVTVVVDYVNIGSVEFDATWKRVPKGPDHDAKLLAELIEAGASDLQGARVTAKPDQVGKGETKTSSYAAVIVEGKAQSVYLQTVFKTQITPHFQDDGTLTLRLKLEKTDTQFGARKDKPRQDLIITTANFPAGKPTLIDSALSPKWRSGKGAQSRVNEPWKQIVFVTATVDEP